MGVLDLVHHHLSMEAVQSALYLLHLSLPLADPFLDNHKTWTPPMRPFQSHAVTAMTSSVLQRSTVVPNSATATPLCPNLPLQTRHTMRRLNTMARRRMARKHAVAHDKLKRRRKKSDL